MAATFSFSEKQRRADAQFRNDEAQSSAETTPPALNADVQRLASTLSSSPPSFVPVTADQFGLYGWCSDGVLEKIKNDGGSIVFGWAIWEWPRVMLTAEFHAVWEDQSNALFDITPKPQGEQRIVFVPDRQYPANFDFDNRPINRRMKLYPDQDIGPLVAAKVADMSPSQREYETGRASKAGKTLEDWVARKISRDPLPQQIDEFIKVCADFDTKLDSLGPAGDIVPDTELRDLAIRKMQGINSLKKIFSKWPA